MRSLLYIGILACLLSCSANQGDLQTGDLLFQATENSDMSEAIITATGCDRQVNFSHVGIAIVSQGKNSVLEASPEGGVQIAALAEFLDRSAKIDGRPVVVTMRLKDTTGVTAAVAHALTYLGRPYDFSFRPDNDKFYCSELVWHCYRSVHGTPLFTARPMNFRAEDGTMPQFWIDLFARQGETVPEGVPGTNPNDMAKEAILTEIHRYF